MYFVNMPCEYALFVTIVAFLTITSGSSDKLCTGHLRDFADEISYDVVHEGWREKFSWKYIFHYETPVGDYQRWKIQLEFPRPVHKIVAYNADTEGPYNNGHVWFLVAREWNYYVMNGTLSGTATVSTYGNSHLDAIALIYNNGIYPSHESLMVAEDQDCSILLERVDLPDETTASPPLEGCDLPPEASDLFVTLDEQPWFDQRGLGFTIRYTSRRGDFKDWIIKLIFSEVVAALEPHNAVVDGPYADGYVWFLKPQSYNSFMIDRELIGSAVVFANSSVTPTVRAVVFHFGGRMDNSILQIDGCIPTSHLVPSEVTAAYLGSGDDETTDPVPTTLPRSTNTDVTGLLPSVSMETVPNFKPSEYVNAEDPYDYNEILHKSILFYEAQRSGNLSSTNRIPWRGDSGLLDGCDKGTCVTDLTGGWYDAGDHMKFGFPMAFTTTVLAWGMIEFRKGYRTSGEWKNALDMLKWSTDYLMKAHVSPNELYFQVGDPKTDHESWGHPETMTMNRPIYKVDKQRPGSEVAAETAAALASASIVFAKSKSANYSTELLEHAKDLYYFADMYRGNYHESVPESNVGQYYKSYSSYKDELTWAAIWLHRATNEPKYLTDAISHSNHIGDSEFSWDQKGPGALVLLSRTQPQFKKRLLEAIDKIMAGEKTPGGLAFIQPWGSNRHAANYALISLMTAKLLGIKSLKGQKYYNFGSEQIKKLLGDGDNSRSYVVGFGTNPPERPHHRSSSCRAWTEDPASKTCNLNDFLANGPNPHTLYGALVGGPDKQGNYLDDRGDYIQNEVAIDYNAGFQSAIAAK